MKMLPTKAQLETRGRLRKLARQYGAPQATDAERKATERARRAVMEQLAKMANGNG